MDLHLPEKTERNYFHSGAQKEYKTAEFEAQCGFVYAVEHHRTNKLGNDVQDTISTKQGTYRNKGYVLLNRIKNMHMNTLARLLI